MMDININDYVCLELTDQGLGIWARSHYSRHSKINGANLKEQLWVVMNVFGEHIFNGGNQVIKNNVITPQGKE